MRPASDEIVSAVSIIIILTKAHVRTGPPKTLRITCTLAGAQQQKGLGQMRYPECNAERRLRICSSKQVFYALLGALGQRVCDDSCRKPTREH